MEVHKHGKLIRVEKVNHDPLPPDVRCIYEDGWSQYLLNDLCVSIGLYYNDLTKAREIQSQLFRDAVDLTETLDPGELQKAYYGWPENQREWFKISLAFNGLSFPF